MIDVKLDFVNFYYKYRNRRSIIHKRRFLKQYSELFPKEIYKIDNNHRYLIINDIEIAKFVITCRFDTKRQLLLKRHKEYLYTKNRTNMIYNFGIDFIFRLVLTLIIMVLFYFTIGYNNLMIIISILIFIVFYVGMINKRNFSSTINLYLIKELIRKLDVVNVAFIIYDKTLPVDELRLVDRDIIYIHLDRCAYGNIIGIQTNMNIDYFVNDDVLIFEDISIDYISNVYLIINTGFIDDKGFFRLYADTKQDTSLNLSLYRQIYDLIKRLANES